MLVTLQNKIITALYSIANNITIIMALGHMV